jgi:TolB protein
MRHLISAVFVSILLIGCGQVRPGQSTPTLITQINRDRAIAIALDIAGQGAPEVDVGQNNQPKVLDAQLTSLTEAVVVIDPLQKGDTGQEDPNQLVWLVTLEGNWRSAFPRPKTTPEPTAVLYNRCQVILNSGTGEVMRSHFYPSTSQSTPPLSATTFPGQTEVRSQLAKLRITNTSAIPLHDLAVIFPNERIDFGDVDGGTTTDYHTFQQGVYRYTAYSVEIDGQKYDQPVVDWIGEKPLEGNTFTYLLEVDPSHWTTDGWVIRLVKVIAGNSAPVMGTATLTSTPSASAVIPPAPPTTFSKPEGVLYFFIFSDITGSIEDPIGTLPLECLSSQDTCPGTVQKLVTTFQHGLDGPISWSPDGKKFALVSSLEGNRDIVVANADSSKVHNLTNSPAAEIDPIWSPDGVNLLYRKDFLPGRGPASEIWMVRPDGTDPRKIANGVAAVWSPDGQKIVYARLTGQSAKIEMVGRDASNPVSVADLPDTWIDGLASSPDGSRLLVATIHNLYLMNLDGSNRVRLARDLEAFTDPLWSPDGQWISFYASTPHTSLPEDHSDLYTVRLDGSGLVNLSNSPFGGNNTAAWSADGKWLVYGSRKDSGKDNIFVSNSDGSEQYRLTFSDTSEEYFYPSWQP